MTQNPLHNLFGEDKLDGTGLLRTLIDDLPDGVYVKDAEGRYLFSNTKHVEVLGAASSEEVAGKSDFDFYPKELAERYRADEQEIVRSGRSLVCREEPRVDEEGTRRWYSTTKVPLRDGCGKIVGIGGITQDVTERKEAEEALRKSEARFRTLIRNSSDVIATVQPDGTVTYESSSVERVLGYKPEELVGRNGFALLHPNDIPKAQSMFAELLSTSGATLSAEVRVRHRDGSWRYLEVTGTNLLHEPSIAAVVANYRDITERKQAEEKLRESEERFRRAFEDAPIGVSLVGLDGRRFKVNRALCEMLGYSEEELLGKDYLGYIHLEDQEISTDYVRRTLEKGAGSYILERRYIHADGHVVWNLTSVSLIQDSQGNPSHFVCLHQDITERKALEEQLRHRAFHDSLTELPNRALFLDRLEHALARASREGGPVAVLLVDLDDFKLINDSLGHDAGNAVLVKTAERLWECVRPGDTVGRLFGDEFAVLLEAPINTEEAKRVTERIRKHLQKPFDIAGREVYVRVSIGIALDGTDEYKPEEVLGHADLAMYEAKKSGKARYEVYSPSMSARFVERMDLEKDLRRAVEYEEFEVHYQPKVELHTNKIVGVEALVRWKHPDKGLLPAAQFISLAEETGLIEQIGLWVCKESCRQIREWRERYAAKPGPLLDLCVNISAREVRQPDLVEKITAVMRETELDPHCLVLEISEGTAVEDAESTIGKLRELKDLGVKLALDDFGTGYCSLVYLEHSLFDVLKIDRQFIHKGRKDVEKCAAITSALIDMTHSLGLQAIVEGVETEEQVAKLKEMGCDIAQGYYFAQPLPSEALERLLEEGSPW